MKKLTWMAAIAALLSAGVANAEGQPSQSKMANLGLSSMNVVSDVEGSQVRGQGFHATTLTFAGVATVTDAVGGILSQATFGGTQSSTFGQEAQTLGTVAYGGSGFGGFTDSTNPSFATFVSTPATVSASFGGVVAASSIQGFSWGAIR